MRLAADQLTKEDIKSFLAPFLTYVTSTASSLQIPGDIGSRNPWVPRLHNLGVDVSFVVTAPSMRKAVLCWSWNKTTSWDDVVAGIDSPSGVTLLWNGTYYRAFGQRLVPFLTAIGVLAQTKPIQPGRHPFNGVIPVQVGEQLKAAAQDAVLKEAEEKTESEVEGEEAPEGNKLRNVQFLKTMITDPTLLRAIDVLGTTGLARLFAPDLARLLDEEKYQPLDFTVSLTQLAAKMSRNRYKGNPPSAEYTPNGLVVVTLPAPLPVQFACQRGGTTTLGPLAAGVVTEGHTLAAPAATGQALTMGVLALGLAAKQAQRGPAQAVQRGRIKLDLNPAEATAIRAATSLDL